MNNLNFKKRTLESDKKRNAESRSFYDVIVDGKSLFDQFVDAHSDLALSIGFYHDSNLNTQIVNEFLKSQKSKLESGRTLLFVCRECGDFGCGAITVEIERKDNSFVWKNFAHESDSFELIESDFINFPSIEFDKTEYETKLNNLIKNWLQQRI